MWQKNCGPSLLACAPYGWAVRLFAYAQYAALLYKDRLVGVLA